MNLRIIPVLAIVGTEFHPRDAAVAAERDAFNRHAFRRFRQFYPYLVIWNIDPRSRRHDKIRSPALAFIKTLRVRICYFDAREPFHMFLAEVTGDDGARRETVPVRSCHPGHPES